MLCNSQYLGIANVSVEVAVHVYNSERDCKMYIQSSLFMVGFRVGFF